MAVLGWDSEGHLGGFLVDENFVTLLNNIFGKEVMHTYRSQCPADWLQMMSNFERLKRGIKPNNTGYTNVPISYEFAEVYQELTGKHIRKCISEEYKMTGVYFARGILRLPNENVIGLFHPVVNAIVEHVQMFLKKPQLRVITHLLLMGGVGESLVLQEAIRRHFGNRLKVLIPQEASLCVMKGAVLLGHHPGVMLVRQARKTYGTAIYPKYDAAKHPDPDKKKEYDGTVRAEGVFRVWIHQGEEIEVGQSRTFLLAPVTAHQKNIDIGVFCTNKKAPKYTDEDEVECITVFTLDLSGTGLERRVEVKLEFGSTEISVKARELLPEGAVASAKIGLV